MNWVAVLTLTDGTRVESSLPSIDEPAANLGAGIYRVLLPCGSITVLETLAEVLAHLREHLEPLDLGGATSPTPAARPVARP